MILIAGGTGTLGRHLIDLLAPHDEVRVLTRDPARAEGLHAELVRGDVRDTCAVAAAVRGLLDGHLSGARFGRRSG
jgi:nucleoside-diphosphate-sugar epimerase